MPRDPADLPQPRAATPPNPVEEPVAPHPLRAVALALGVSALLLAVGRSGEILDAAYGFDSFWGSETLVAVAETWHRAMAWLGIPDATRSLRDLLALAD